MNKHIYIDILRILSAAGVIILHGTALGDQIDSSIVHKFLWLNIMTRVAVPIFFYDKWCITYIKIYEVK